MASTNRPAFINIQGQKTLNREWLVEAFDFHASYLLNIEKALLELRNSGLEAIYITPKGPAQRKAVYSVAEYYSLGFSSRKISDQFYYDVAANPFGPRPDQNEPAPERGMHDSIKEIKIYGLEKMQRIGAKSFAEEWIALYDGSPDDAATKLDRMLNDESRQLTFATNPST
eukprot:TRINITY_DN15500_c0_g1_i1.p1 TRINITY_DN15500_c0_g1~~TRINITY_DN15500_c0_g1_i1.p1  ORF type:complete len:171 (-),score=25.61 TRINITY_DN15500_c0_g1_i1:158-670(-)